MSKTNTPQVITIDGTEFDANDFNEQEVVYLNHCLDLDRKIGSRLHAVSATATHGR